LNDRQVLGNRIEIDIWIPDHNIGIECDGAWWHSEGGRPEVKSALVKKRQLAAEKGIRLVHIMDFEWLEKRSIIEHRLRHLLNKTPTISARSCRTEWVSREQAQQFLEEHHLHGAGVGEAVGLLHQDQLVAVAQVAKPRFSEHDLELVRYATTGVTGGLGKLLKEVRRVKSPRTIISYADNSWGDGEVYGRLGFTRDGDTGLSFFYVNSRGERRSRQQLQKKKLLVMHGLDASPLTEVQLAAQLGWYRAWRPGSTRWILTC
jgi:hypothetical protein